MKRKHIWVWWASVVWWAWDREMWGWVSRLRHYLDNHTQEGTLVYNLGISGETTRELLKRFDIEYTARIPYIVLLSVGLNDSCFFSSWAHKVELPEYEKNLFSLCSLIDTKKSIIIIVGCSDIDESKTLPWKEDRFWDKKTATMYNETAKIFCQKNNIPFIDLTNVLSPGDIEDGLHPNAQGHEKIFQLVKNFLIEEEYIS